jgi:lysozyme
VICGAVVVILLIVFGALYIRHMTVPTIVKGVDVSHYQGEISWRVIKDSANVKFVYIKATEGSTYRDPDFSKNWAGALNNGISPGAYHFFVSTSSGADQAKNFIATVPKKKGEMPPAIDIEGNVTKASDFKAQLAVYVKEITAHYGTKPVFYVPYQVYNFLYDDYYNYNFWIIDSKANPLVKNWTFRQYSSTGTIAGINGKVDLDQYKGSLWNYKKMMLK